MGGSDDVFYDFILFEVMCSPQATSLALLHCLLKPKEIFSFNRVVNTGLKAKRALNPKGNCSQ